MPRKPLPEQMERYRAAARETASKLWAMPKAKIGAFHAFRINTIGRGGGKGIIVQAFYARPKESFGTLAANRRRGRNCYWAYYPKPEEAEKFADSLEHLVERGPAFEFPGSVGTIRAYILPDKTMQISSIQGSFIQKKTPGLTAWMTAKHGGWRQHLLDELFLDAIKSGIKRVCFSTPMIGESERTRRIIAIFLRAARKHGFRRVGKKEERHFIVVEKK